METGNTFYHSYVYILYIYTVYIGYSHTCKHIKTARDIDSRQDDKAIYLSVLWESMVKKKHVSTENVEFK